MFEIKLSIIVTSVVLTVGELHCMYVNGTWVLQSIETIEIAKKPKLTFYTDQNMRCKIPLTEILNWTWPPGRGP